MGAADSRADWGGHNVKKPWLPKSRRWVCYFRPSAGLRLGTKAEEAGRRDRAWTCDPFMPWQKGVPSSFMPPPPVGVRKPTGPRNARSRELDPCGDTRL